MGKMEATTAVPVGKMETAALAVPVAQVVPVVQEMERTPLRATHGVVLRQDTQGLESVAAAFGVPYEAKNRYRVSPLPKGARVGNSPGDRRRWKPTARELSEAPIVLYAKEESDLCERVVLTCCGCANLRTLKVRFFDANQNEQMRIDRQCRLGGQLCCPIVTEVLSRDEQGNLVLIGRVRENFDNYPARCCQLVCCCTGRELMELRNPSSGLFEPTYELHVNTSCLGRTNNCFGSTCLRNDMVFHVTNPANGVKVSNVQKTFAGGGDSCGSLLRMCFGFSNYLVEFPDGASEEQRRLLIAATLHSEYIFFEKDSGSS